MSDGTIEQRDGTVIFRYERLLPHPVEVVPADGAALRAALTR